MDVEIKWGCVLGLIYCIYYTILYSYHIEAKYLLSLNFIFVPILLITLITFIPIILGIYNKNKFNLHNHHNITNSFTIGMKIVVIGSTIAGLYTIIYKTVIDPNYHLTIATMTNKYISEMGISVEENIQMMGPLSLFNLVRDFLLTILVHITAGMFKAYIAGVTLNYINKNKNE